MEKGKIEHDERSCIETCAFWSIRDRFAHVYQPMQKYSVSCLCREKNKLSFSSILLRFFFLLPSSIFSASICVPYNQSTHSELNVIKTCLKITAQFDRFVNKNMNRMCGGIDGLRRRRWLVDRNRCSRRTSFTLRAVASVCEA